MTEVERIYKTYFNDVFLFILSLSKKGLIIKTIPYKESPYDKSFI